MDYTEEVIEKVEVKYQITENDLTYMDTVEMTKEEYEGRKQGLNQEFKGKFDKWKKFIRTKK